MPTKPAPPCSRNPSCPNRRPCPVHDIDDRPSSTERGYDTRWRRTRADYLADHRTCERPDCDRPATDVDHIDGLGPNGPLGHDWSNLKALCHPHHSEKTVAENRGFGR